MVAGAVKGVGRGFVYIDSRKLPTCRKNPKGRNRHYVTSVIDGVRRMEGACDLLKDAKAKKRQIESQLANGTYGQIERGNITFLEFFNIWWVSMLARLSPGSLRQYRLSYDRRIMPFLGHYRLVDLTPEIIQRFVDSLEGLSPSYVAMIYSHLRSALSSAVAQDYLSKSPCRGIILPRIRRTVKPILEPDEISLLVDVCDDPYRTLFALLGYSGIRIGEALALRRRHIYLKRHEIRIEEAWDTNCREFGLPKTDAGIRTIIMLGVLEEELREYFDTFEELKPGDLLFPSPDDTDRPLSYTTVRGNFRSALQAAGLPLVNIHSLRHSLTSVLLAAGISIAEITNQLGHRDPVVTLRVYSHRIRSGRGEGFRRADDLFRADGDST